MGIFEKDIKDNYEFFNCDTVLSTLILYWLYKKDRIKVSL